MRVAQEVGGWQGQLNPEQLNACLQRDGPLLVLAGPGTGKTRVITYRYLNLLQPPELTTDSILVLTFTDKAAQEMEERITTLCRTGFTRLWVSTFHAFCNRLLSDDGGRLPIPHPFRIASDAERWLCLASVLEELRPPELYRLPRPRDVIPDLLKLIERAKQELAGPEQYLAMAQGQVRQHRLDAARQQQIAAVYAAHQARLLGRGLLDFDDTIYWTVRLLESDENLLRAYRVRFRYIMVDEFQDTNFAQMRLVELLAGDAANVAVVGDDDQSIYKFRGASVANLRRFSKVFPARAIVRLEKNYRSTEPILAAASRLVAHNKERIQKQVVSDRVGPAVRLYVAPDRDHEIAWGLERTVELLEQGVPAAQIAGLVRTNAQLRPYARALQRSGIPYQLSGGRGFLDQPEIKDLRALLQLVASPLNSLAACRVLSMPGVDVPPALVQRISARAAADGTTVEDAARAVDLEGSAEAFTHLARVLGALRAVSLRETVDEVMYQALEQTRYVDLLDYPSEIQRRQAGANVGKLVEMAEQFSEVDGSGDGATLAAFIEHLDVVEESRSEEGIAPIDTGADAVRLMTVHQAKGLEFDAVLCPGLVEERFPQRGRAERLPLPQELIVEELSTRDHALDEERRLLFVAITRARRHLLLSCAARYEGSKRWKPSRFLGELGLLPGADGKVAQPVAAEAAPQLPPVAPALAAQAALPISHPELPELVLSYSQIDGYRTCPRAYQYRHVYQLPTRPTAELQFGVAIHRALQQILQESLATDGKTQPSLPRAIEIFEASFNARRFCDPVNADLWLERGRIFLGAMHQKGRLSAGSLHVPPEQPFNLRLAGFRVAGRIDRIDRTPEGYRLIDYKTGEVRADWELERDLQLGLYAIAADEVFNLKPVELAICYLDDATEIPVMKTTSQLAADREAAEAAAIGIMAGDFSPRPEPWKCQHCDFRLVCDAAL